MQVKSFEDYLKNIHAESYQGTDDDMPDDFDNWLTDLGVDEVIAYAEAWGKELVSEFYN